MSRAPWGWLLLLGSVIAPVQAQTAVEYIHTDALGSPVAVTNAAGQVVERIDYEPYGAAIGKVVDGVGYAGHVMDGITGLTYMQQRYYDPQCGCFLSVDPVTAYSNDDMRFFNRYAYAFNNPFRFYDPDGRCTGSRIENQDGTCKSTGGYTTQSGPARSFSSVLGQRARTPSSQARLIENVGGDPKTMEYARETHESFVAVIISLVTGGEFLVGAKGVGATGEVTTVIGRVNDLQKLGHGEKSLLERLPNLGNPKANWQQNAGVLRSEMRLGKPIRDASPGDTAGQFLNAERNLLRSHGWTFDPKTNFWMPPTP